jgi:hypothetical protein
MPTRTVISEDYDKTVERWRTIRALVVSRRDAWIPDRLIGMCRSGHDPALDTTATHKTGCAVCAKMWPDGADYDACPRCPVRLCCWPNPMSPYMRIQKALTDEDVTALLVAIDELIAEVESGRAVVDSVGGTLTVEL